MNSFYSRNEMKNLGIKKFGKDVRISKLAVLTRPEMMSVGSHVAIDPFVYISPQIEIGDYVHIAPFVGIGGSSKSRCELHDFAMIGDGCKLICASDDFSGNGLIGPVIPEIYRKVTHGKIVLEKLVVLGVNTVVMPNVTIYEGAAVGACSLVTQDLEAWTTYYGVPAKPKKPRRKDLLLKYARELEKCRNQL